MTLGAVLAKHIAHASFDALPEPALGAARRSLIDTMAVGWGARGAPGVGEIARAALQSHEGGCSTLWQTGNKGSARSVAFANSVAAAALDFDSIHPGAAVHPDIVSVPVALAVGESASSSGKEVLAAIALGSDLLCRLALSTRANSGWFYTSVYGPIVSGAITARLLGASVDAIENAMGLGYMSSSGTYQPIVERSLSKRALAAFAADSGVLCGHLAAAGLSGPREWMEGTYGLQSLYERGDLKPVTEDLGAIYRNAEISIKPYPSCQANHAPIDAMLALRPEARSRMPDIADIEVIVSPYMSRLVGARYEPGANPQVAAQFSVQYSLACALLRGRLGIADVCEAAARDAQTTEWAARVRVVVDPDNRNNYCPATVRITLRDGTVLSRTASVLRGSMQAPFTQDELIEKLTACLDAGGYDARPRHVQAIFDALMRIDEAPHVGTWMSDVHAMVGAK